MNSSELQSNPTVGLWRDVSTAQPIHPCELSSHTILTRPDRLTHSIFERVHWERQALESGYATFRELWIAFMSCKPEALLDLTGCLARFPLIARELPALRSELVAAARDGATTVIDTAAICARCSADTEGTYTLDAFHIKDVLVAIAFKNGFEFDCDYQTSPEDDQSGPTKLILRVRDVPPDQKLKNMLWSDLHAVYASTLFPEGLDHLSLGQHGETCYRVAALYSLARHPLGAEFLTDLFSNEDNGIFRVTFPGVPHITLDVGVEAYDSAVLGDFRASVSGSLGSRIILAAYGALENALDDYRHWKIGVSDGGHAGWVLHRMTGATPFWLTTKGEEWVFCPTDEDKWPAEYKNHMSICDYDKNFQPLPLADGVYAWLNHAKDNSAYILTCATHSVLSEEDRKRLFPGHAYALTEISGSGIDLVLSVVDPKNTDKGVICLNIHEFSRSFHRICGVKFV